MKKLLLTLLMVCASLPLQAEDTAPQETPAVDCVQIAKEIKATLVEPVTCFRDSECRTVSWGCPWQMAPCHFSIYSLSEEDKNKELSKKVSLYSKVCVINDPEMKEKCSAFYDFLSENQCKVRSELSCIAGFCLTPSQIILPREGEDAADIYGSREVLGE